ncbi:glycerol-3-phosphate O-acyltransferase [Polychytrium aggregatum]|uniref:glycerol-3-phosphate O-acyltransferase n=1 Tax=Polychytrium aggregatum TaxID=110093 RepID=UPI0022FE2E2D|nr:glycerol-3-phosphate O-acyltransferase [Polychytrium aggregatum]KAI9206208.1 glycerol-3-phosphate O-acyltransferase [Polychytrium aggregatum]
MTGPSSSSLVSLRPYDLVVFMFTVFLNIFFREVKLRGVQNIPKSGPVIFVIAPHHNQFIDPLIIATNTPRRIGFLAAAKSMQRKFVGSMGRALESIPVVRPQDLAFPGVGTVKFATPDNHSEILISNGTTEKLHVRAVISVKLPAPHSKRIAMEVAEIVSETLVRLKSPVTDPDAIQLLAAKEYPFSITPHVEQAELFNSVSQRLSEGRCVGIFPEGGSHDRSSLLPIKAGVAIMALSAMAKYENLSVKIVPVSLNYFHPHRFRSRAVVEYGEPIAVSQDWVDRYKEGGQPKRDATQELLNLITMNLKEMTITAPDYETLMLIQATRRLYKPLNRKLSTTQTVSLTRRFVQGYIRFKDDPQVVALQDRVSNYNKKLLTFGIHDHQVQRSEIGGYPLVLLLWSRIVRLIILSTMALPGVIMNLPMMLITGYISNLKAKQALAESNVKITGRDVVSTWKLLIAMALIPLFFVLYTILFYLYLGFLGLTFSTRLTYTLCFWFSLASLSYAAVLTSEVALDIIKSLRPLIGAITQKKDFEWLRKERAELAQKIQEFCEKTGPLIEKEMRERRERLRLEGGFESDSVSDFGKSPFTSPAGSGTETDGSLANRVRASRQTLLQRVGSYPKFPTPQAEDQTALDGSAAKSEKPSRAPLSESIVYTASEDDGYAGYDEDEDAPTVKSDLRMRKPHSTSQR